MIQDIDATTKMKLGATRKRTSESGKNRGISTSPLSNDVPYNMSYVFV